MIYSHTWATEFSGQDGIRLNLCRVSSLGFRTILYEPHIVQISIIMPMAICLARNAMSIMESVTLPDRYAIRKAQSRM